MYSCTYRQGGRARRRLMSAVVHAPIPCIRHPLRASQSNLYSRAERDPPTRIYLDMNVYLSYNQEAGFPA